MMMAEPAAVLRKLIEELAGQKIPLDSKGPEKAIEVLSKGIAIGYSQFNELLLMMGYDRITHEFFQYLVDGSTAYSSESALFSLEQFREGVDRFRQLALLFYGNVKFAFKLLSQTPGLLNDWLWKSSPRDEEDFAGRHDPIQPLIPIRGEETYFLGYLVQRELTRRLEQDPTDEE